MKHGQEDCWLTPGELLSTARKAWRHSTVGTAAPETPDALGSLIPCPGNQRGSFKTHESPAWTSDAETLWWTLPAGTL